MYARSTEWYYGMDLVIVEFVVFRQLRFLYKLLLFHIYYLIELRESSVYESSCSFS